MKKLISSIFVLFCVFSMTAYAESKEIAGVKVPETITVEGQELNFNGGGIRSKWFMSLYVGSLYLPESTDNPNEVIGGDKPMAITLDIVSGMITSLGRQPFIGLLRFAGFQMSARLLNQFSGRGRQRRCSPHIERQHYKRRQQRSDADHGVLPRCFPWYEP